MRHSVEPADHDIAFGLIHAHRHVEAPVVEQRFDASGDVWDLADLDSRLGGYFADRDPAVGFAADSVMDLGNAPTESPTTEGSR